MQNFLVNRYAGLYCNDIENRIKSLLITKRDYCGGEQALFTVSVSEDDIEE